VYFQRLGEMGEAPVHHVAVTVARMDAVAEMLFDAGHFERRLEFAVGHRFQAIARAGHADEALDVGIPRGDVVVADRPVDAIALPFGRGEFVLAPALAAAPPDQRPAADLIAAEPVEGPFLHVGVFVVLDEEVRVVLAGDLAHERVGFGQLAWQDAAMRQLPRSQVGGGVVLDVGDVAAALQHQRFQPLLAQLLGRPAAGNAGADDDGVEGVFGGCAHCAGVRMRLRNSTGP
jgi:hypothetical protein